MSDSVPYLSIVATSRNDDHGGDLAGRTQVFVDTLAAHCAAYNLSAELILVDWNPPADAPPLAASIRRTEANSSLDIRAITVPAAVHRRFEHAGSLPLFQMKAKNAGIRRARGRFVLATNIDIVLSAQLAAYIGARKLQPGRLYRVERHDISPAPPVGVPLDAVLNFCESHVIRVNRRDASIDTRDGVSSPVYPKRHRVLGHLPRDLLRDIAHGVMPWTRNGRANIRANWSYIHDEFARPPLMTNASGDFMLMDRDSWFDLHGYAEWDIYSFHLDAIFCHQAAASGRREAFLEPPRLVWHIEHARGSGFVPEDPDSLWRRLEAAGVPWLKGERAQQIIRDLHRGQLTPEINDGNWGLAGLDLEERPLADAGEAS